MGMRNIRVAPYFRDQVTPRMREMVNHILDTGILSHGEYSQEFERRFSTEHGCAYGILSNSGTSALQVALQAMKEIHHWHDGDEVIIPATTFVATANIVVHNRMVPVFVDVDSLTYNIDPALIERAITPKTRAIIPVHLLGQPADMSSVIDIAHNHNLKVIEDSCECIFVNHREKPVGSWGDIGCFSFYVAHLLVTGVGGMCTTSNPFYAARIRSLVNHGMDMAQLNPGENFTPRPNPNRRFFFSSVGYSYRITELDAALGLAQMDTIRESIERRWGNAQSLTTGIQTYVNLEYPEDPIRLSHLHVPMETENAWMMYPIVLRRGLDKEPLMAHLNARGIETRDLLPLINQPAYARSLFSEDYPVSQWLIESGFYVGCHQGLTLADMDTIVQSLKDYFDTDRERTQRENSRAPAALPA